MKMNADCWLGHGRTLVGVAGLAGYFALTQLASAASAVGGGPASVVVDAPVRFDLPADTLVATVRRIAEQTRQEVRFDTSSLRGWQSRPVRGDYDAAQALLVALDGLPLTVRRVSDGVLQLESTSSAQVTVIARRGQGEVAFKADRSATSTRSDAALLDLPSSVTVVTGQVLTSQMSGSVRDALSNVSGLTFSQSPQGRDTFSIRGFNSTALASNGLKDGYAADINPVSVERVEVLKGPQAILVGSDALGGGVNVVSKRPQADRINALSFQYGTGGVALLGADLSGKVASDDGRLTYRVTGSRQVAGDTDSGFDGERGQSFMPQLRWKDGGTDITVGAAYSRTHRPTPEYTVVGVNRQLMPQPAQRIGAPGDGFDVRSTRVFYDLSQRLSSDITLVSRLQRTNGSQDVHLYSLTESLGVNGASMVYGGVSRSESHATSGDHFLKTDFATGAVSHKLSVGVSHTVGNGRSAQLDNYDHYFPVSLYPAVATVYPDPREGAIEGSVLTSTTRERGFYVQDLMSWGDWNLMLNLRRSRFDEQGQMSFPGAADPFVFDPLLQWVNTPSAGVVYKVSDDNSVYASVSKGFAPQSGLACAGGTVPAQKSKNAEIGLKWDLLDNKLSVTTALFSLEQSQVLQFDFAGGCYNMVSGLNTKGFEADVQGQVMPGWNLIANYSYNRFSNPSDPADLFAGLPKHKFNAWSVHEVIAVPGLKAGVGIVASSKAEGSARASTAFALPSTLRLDASLMYEFGGWEGQLMVKNLADRKNYTASGADTYVPFDTRRSVAVRLSRDFK